MRSFLRAARAWLAVFGFHPLALLSGLRGMPRYLRDYAVIRAQRKRAATVRDWPLSLNVPCLTNWVEQSGTASGDYFHQDLLVAQRIYDENPTRHIDVGSRIDGFVAHVASYRSIEVIDIRDLKVNVRNILFRQCDLMSPPADLVGSCDSLSCLHALEHFGLGRYGDPIKQDGYVDGLRGLTGILREGGRLYLSVPIGPQRIEFNGHRVFSIKTILDLAAKDLDLQTLSYVDDAGALHENVSTGYEEVERNYGVYYGCAIFEFIKRPAIQS